MIFCGLPITSISYLGTPDNNELVSSDIAGATLLVVKDYTGPKEIVYFRVKGTRLTVPVKSINTKQVANDGGRDTSFDLCNSLRFLVPWLLLGSRIVPD